MPLLARTSRHVSTRAHDTALAAKRCHAGVRDLSFSIAENERRPCHWLEATAISCIKCHGVCDDQSVFRVKRQSGCDRPVGRGEGARIDSWVGLSTLRIVTMSSIRSMFLSR
jgi:hypothetical protein